ncbi:MAG TPA: hypothetical protein VLA05_05355 [Coriobacteriia bacterium]|nr:hypothetical protein [Coriobacteriia bacterium]
MTKTYRGIVAFCLVIALATGVTAAIGAFGRGDGSTASATSIRGEQFEYTLTGVYAYNPVRVVAEGVGWDWLTLFVAVPALLIALPWIARGSLRARLFAVGILGYFVYQYLMYSVFWAFGPLFVPFIIIYSASATAIVWIVSTVDVPALPARYSDRVPRKTMGVVSTFMALTIVMMWAERIAAGYRGDWVSAGLLGMPTMSVQALDLGIVVPLAIATSVLIWRRHRWGYLLAPVFAVKAVTMAGAICAMLISAAMVEGALQVQEFALFGVATLLFGLLAYRILASISLEKDQVEAESPAKAPLATA